MTEQLQLRLHHAGVHPTLIHLPGMHGDWTLLGPFRQALRGRAGLVEVTYPRRAEWQLPDYSAAVQAALVEHRVSKGWLLAESFSSQVGWQIAGDRVAAGAMSGVHVEGMILVGGFVRHPVPFGVRLGQHASRAAPRWLLKTLCGLYGRRHCGDPEVAAEIAEFVRRRLVPEDRLAMNSRYHLIASTDLRAVARRMTRPVFHLSGAMDPLVPWPLVRRWLRRHCPGFRASRIIARGGHNVLLSAAAESAEQILKWTAPVLTGPSE